MKNVFNELSENQAKEQLEEMKKLLPSREEEALSLWRDKPAEERLKRVGWFRKEEDKDQRNTFVKKYIDKHFEKYLKEELKM